MGTLAENSFTAQESFENESDEVSYLRGFRVLRTVECRNGLKYRVFMFSNSMFLLQKFGYWGSVCGANAC